MAHGETYKGTKSAYNIMRGDYVTKQNILYSSGAQIDETNDMYPQLVFLCSKSWTKESSYVDIVWIISIGVMIEAPIDLIRQLETLIIENEYYDYLIDFLFHSIDATWIAKSNAFRFNNVYNCVYDVINSSTKEISLTRLERYLTESWYRGHRDMAWYNMHKKENSFYDGYWSFESGAIAKILGLDDTGWETMKYYPYDMVHYKE
jgi:hypothetical protein